MTGADGLDSCGLRRRRCAATVLGPRSWSLGPVPTAVPGPLGDRSREASVLGRSPVSVTPRSVGDRVGTVPACEVPGPAPHAAGDRCRDRPRGTLSSGFVPVAAGYAPFPLASSVPWRRSSRSPVPLLPRPPAGDRDRGPRASGTGPRYLVGPGTDGSSGGRSPGQGTVPAYGLRRACRIPAGPGGPGTARSPVPGREVRLRGGVCGRGRRG